MTKDLKTSMEVTNQGFPVVDNLLIELTQWAEKVQSGKWLVHVYQDLTKEQRGYFHASIVPHFVRIQQDLGTKITPDEAKEYLKEKFLGKKIVEYSDKTGKKYKRKVIRSSESLSKQEYSKLIQDCTEWMIDYFGSPPPEARV